MKVSFDGFGLNCHESKHADRLATIPNTIENKNGIGQEMEKRINAFAPDAGPTHAIHLDAGHDTNGNPKRCYLCVRANGDIVDCVDEGYQGVAGLHLKYPGLRVTLGIRIGKAERNALLKQYGN